MWADGDDTNPATGERVRLYQPIQYASGRSFSTENLTTSYIGGPQQATTCDSGTTNPCCRNCQQPMFQIVQLHIPGSRDNQSRTYHLFGCNRATCVNELFEKNNCNFSMGGDGVFVCHRSSGNSSSSSKKKSPIKQRDKTTTASIEGTTTSESAADATSSDPWGGMDDDDNNDMNDWDVSPADNHNNSCGLDDLEEKLAAMEMKTTTTKTISEATDDEKKKPSGTSKKSLSSSSSSSSSYSFPCFELHSVLEPPGKRLQDKDDVGVMSTGTYYSDDKIHNMLARYMAEEEDEDILAAIRDATGDDGGAFPTTGGTRNGKGRKGERDERLSQDDRALFTFSDRVKRSPRQVIRYALGGTPLWSIPTTIPSPASDKKTSTKSQRQRQRKHRQQEINDEEEQQQQKQQMMQIPKCSTCGSDRVFEFQVMPSILHVLNVDKYSSSIPQKQQQQHDDDNNNQDLFMNGGMNWGAIAVYTCSQNCQIQYKSEEYILLQVSADGQPSMGGKKKKGPIVLSPNPDNCILVNEQENMYDEMEDCKFDDGDDEDDDNEDDFDDIETDDDDDDDDDCV